MRRERRRNMDGEGMKGRGKPNVDMARGRTQRR